MILPARILVLVLLVTWPASVFAQHGEASVGKLVVATRHVPPFAIKGEEGNWSGITTRPSLAADFGEGSALACGGRSSR